MTHLQRHDETNDDFVRRTLGPAMVGIAEPAQAELLRELGEDYVRWCRQAFGRRIVQRLQRHAHRDGQAAKGAKGHHPRRRTRVNGAA